MSADPVTLAEFEVATERFVKRRPEHAFFSNLSPCSCDEPYDAGLVVIDLVARLVVVDSTYSSPDPAGCVFYHDGESSTDVRLQYHLAEDWRFTSDGLEWRGVAQSRRAERAARPLLDAREVFYGRPLLEYVAREIYAGFLGCEANAAQLRTPCIEETIREIHAAWLLTPRADLGGASPRDVAFQQRDHLMWDLQDRCDQWSRLEECPRGLDESSFAFRYGGFGTHELVEYYELVRELLWSSRDWLMSQISAPSPSGPPETLTAKAFVATEVPRLETVRDQWLDSPDAECHDRTPRSIIQRERARIPEAVSGREAMVDPDCPCCQMMADMSGPFFWHLDGSNMDDDFAFDIYHRTREEWEEEHRNGAEIGLNPGGPARIVEPKTSCRR